MGIALFYSLMDNCIVRQLHLFYSLMDKCIVWQLHLCYSLIGKCIVCQLYLCYSLMSKCIICQLYLCYLPLKGFTDFMPTVLPVALLIFDIYYLHFLLPYHSLYTKLYSYICISTYEIVSITAYCFFP